MIAPPEQGITPDAWILMEYDEMVFILADIGDCWRRSTAIEKLNCRDSSTVVATTHSGSTYILDRLDESITYEMRTKLKSLRKSGAKIMKLEELI